MLELIFICLIVAGDIEMEEIESKSHFSNFSILPIISHMLNLNKEIKYKVVNI